MITQVLECPLAGSIVESEGSTFFDGPTVLIDSQSATALAGIPAEQAYMRLFLLGQQKDLFVTNVPIDPDYIDYLIQILGLETPEILNINPSGGSSVTEDILNNPQILQKIKEWLEIHNGQVQFFNVTPFEAKLMARLRKFPATCGNLEKAIDVGSKPGFRKLCKSLGVPVPRGYSCTTLGETVEAFYNLKAMCLIKACDGTGGTELQSNVVASPEECEESGQTVETYIQRKLESFGNLLGDEWVVEEYIHDGREGSVHVYIPEDGSDCTPYILGALTKNNSYVGGFFPYTYDDSDNFLLKSARDLLIPALKELGVLGFHCFDFRGSYFLEDNVRPGALDFIHGFIQRIRQQHFPNKQYAWYHCHVPITKEKTSFSQVRKLLDPYMDPTLSNFVVVTNPQVLPHGRDIDITCVATGDNASVAVAQYQFEEISKLIQKNL